jgi:hypothetical protein
VQPRLDAPTRDRAYDVVRLDPGDREHRHAHPTHRLHDFRNLFFELLGWTRSID